jgi:hypothetical protein
MRIGLGWRRPSGLQQSIEGVKALAPEVTGVFQRIASAAEAVFMVRKGMQR